MFDEGVIRYNSYLKLCYNCKKYNIINDKSIVVSVKYFIVLI